MIIVENGQKLTPEEASRQLKEQGLEFSPDAGSIISTAFDVNGSILASSLKAAGHAGAEVTHNIFMVPLSYSLYLKDEKDKNGDAGITNHLEAAKKTALSLVVYGIGSIAGELAVGAVLAPGLAVTASGIVIGCGVAAAGDMFESGGKNLYSHVSDIISNAVSNNKPLNTSTSSSPDLGKAMFQKSTEPVDNKYMSLTVDHNFFQKHQQQDMSTQYLNGLAAYGGQWRVWMPAHVLNGDGYSNTIPSYMTTNGYRPGANELSNTNIKSNLQHLMCDHFGQNAREFANACYVDAKLYTNIDPIVLDLTGDGLHLKNFLEEPVLFDMDNDGYKEQTGWIKPGMGILVVDRNNNGKIDDVSEMISEYYMRGFTNGFAVLKKLDLATRDGVIDARDPIYHKLKVWISTDGINGEIVSLKDLGITTLRLAATEYTKEADDETGGNNPLLVSTFVMHGKEHKMYDVQFKVNPIGSKIVSLPTGEEVALAENGVKTYKAVMNGETIDLRKLDANIAIGSTGNDTFIANDKGNWFFGNEGVNTYYGGNGDDVFVLAPDDTHKNVHGGEGFNTVILTGDKGKYFNMHDANVQALYGSDYGDIIVSGGNKNAFITGGNGGNILIGGGANDVINAGNGGDYIYGGGGNNILRGGKGDDRIYGGAGSNYIEGRAGNNFLFGNVSDDVIVSGSGDDYIDGVGGYNTAVFHGPVQDYKIYKNSTGKIIVEDKFEPRDGHNTLVNISRLSFADATMDITKKILIPTDKYVRYTGNEKSINIPVRGLLDQDPISMNSKPMHIRKIYDVVGGKVEFTTYRVNEAYLISKTYVQNGRYYTPVLECIHNIKFIPDPNFKGVAHFKFSATDEDGNVTTVQEVGKSTDSYAKAYVFFTKDEYPTDRLFYKQWYISEHNVLPVWKSYTGQGVKINIVEPDIFDFNHFDLSANVDPDFLSSIRAKEEAIGAHGTQVAGIIASERNGKGTIGIAYNSKISGEQSTQGDYFYNYDKYDVVNHSFGYDEPFALNMKTEPLLNKLFHQHIANGRDGLGTVIVFGAGNDREINGDANTNNTHNSAAVITVAAINKETDIGVLERPVTSFSSKGANILISALGSHMYTASKYLIGDNDAKFGEEFSTHNYGTSFATPVVTGIVALMLEANPYLGAVDVQRILGYTARKIDSTETTWLQNASKLWNGVGLHYSQDFGFGSVDAYAAVKLAETWTVQNTLTNASEVSYTNTVRSIIYDSKTSLVKDFSVDADMLVQRVLLTVDVNKKHIGDLKIILVSPSGTESVILDRLNVPLNKTDASRGYILEDGKLKFQFSSTHFMGECTKGEWKVKILDTSDDANDKTTINNIELGITGTDNSADKILVFTDEFFKLPYTQTLSITNADKIETLNLAALSGNHTIDLRGGTNNNFGGKTIKLDATNLKNAIAGDGNNTLIGNDGDNILIGGSGDNSLYGINGHNILVGGKGENHLYSGKDSDMFVIRDNPGHKDTIHDFRTADTQEIINIANVPGIKSYSDLRLEEDSKGTHIYFANQEVFVVGVHKNDLTAEHFRFDYILDFFAQFDPNHLHHEWNGSLVRAVYGLKPLDCDNL